MPDSRDTAPEPATIPYAHYKEHVATLRDQIDWLRRQWEADDYKPNEALKAECERLRLHTARLQGCLAAAMAEIRRVDPEGNADDALLVECRNAVADAEEQ